MCEFKAKNLVLYQNSGYEGCHWEWNCVLENEFGWFKSVFQSGRHFPFNNTELDKLVDDFGFTEVKRFDLTKFGQNKHELNSVNCAFDLDDECGGPYMLWNQISIHLARIGIDCKFRCQYCDKTILITNAHISEQQVFFAGEHGNGGVGTAIDTPICQQCFNKYSCVNCGNLFSINDELEDVMSLGKEYCICCNLNFNDIVNMKIQLRECTAEIDLLTMRLIEKIKSQQLTIGDPSHIATFKKLIKAINKHLELLESQHELKLLEG